MASSILGVLLLSLYISKETKLQEAQQHFNKHKGSATHRNTNITEHISYVDQMFLMMCATDMPRRTHSTTNKPPTWCVANCTMKDDYSDHGTVQGLVRSPQVQDVAKLAQPPRAKADRQDC